MCQKEKLSDEEIAVKIAEKVHDAGGTAYYVGGCVRDKILGIESKDIDIEIHDITVSKLREILDECGQRNEMGVSFGVFGLHGYDIDIALPRKERSIGEKHTDFLIESNPFMSCEDAARRRDFTINAFMQNILTSEIFDFFNGKEDLKNGIIRHVNDKSFCEDPLRVFRAAQFAARFGFKIADATMEICRSMDTTLLSKERVFGEMKKALLKSEKPSVFFEILYKMGKLDYWFDEVKILKTIPQHQVHHQEGNVWNHTMMVLDEAANRKNIVNQPLFFMISALCHDFGKAVTTEEKNGVYHAYNHEVEGIAIAEAFITRLVNEKKLKKYVLNMVKYHMKPNVLADANSKIKSTNKLFYSSVDPFDLIQLSICDSIGKMPSENKNEQFLLKRLDIYNEYISRPYVKGKDLLDSGIIPARNISTCLRYALKLRLAGIDKESVYTQTLAYARKNKLTRKQ